MKKILIASTSLLALCLALPAAGEGTGTSPGGYGGMSSDTPSSGTMPPPAVDRGTDQTQSGKKASRKDRNFIEDVAIGNMAEIQNGQLAQQRAQNQMVRDYANMMVNDHGPAGERLSSLAAALGVTPPTELDWMHRRMAKKLREANEGEFDALYIKSQVKDHRKMVELLEDQIEDGEDAELKRFASEMLPKVREHLVMAQRLEEQVKKK
jgi:putative membrane protein